MIEEVWVPVYRYEKSYEVSNLGRVRSFDQVIPHLGSTRLLRGRIMKESISVHGYLQVYLTDGNGCKQENIHKLVLTSFSGPRPEVMECRHLNGIKTDNRLTNLVWGTPKQNGEDRVILEEAVRGESCGTSKLSDDKVVTIRKKYAEGVSQGKLSKIYGVTQAAISNVVNRKTWTHI